MIPYTPTEIYYLIDNVNCREDCQEILDYLEDFCMKYPMPVFDEIMDNLNAIISVLNLQDGLI